MASKKDKILESAQKFVLKGQIDKAIKDYQQVVAMEPNDIRFRQRLAELLVRDNRKEEAIQQYEDIGKHYADNCYYLKAIAIYKQIQRLNPGSIPTALNIAWLNHQQGLIGNALAEYGQVAAQYEKENLPKEALKVVEKMLEVDHDHAATRLKYAELLYVTGAHEQSREAYQDLAAAFKAKGLNNEAASVAARLTELFPEHLQTPAASITAEPLEVSLPTDPFGGGASVTAAAEQPAAAWEIQEPADEPELPEWESEEAELPDPFAPAPAGPEEVVPAPVEAPSPWEAAPVPEAAVAETAWEEEIELDLGDDLFEAPEEAAPATPLVLSVPEPAPVEEPEAVATELELPMELPMELDFEEAAESVEEPEEEVQAAVELDFEEEESLELTLPQEASPFGDFEWESEPEELAEVEQLHPEEAELAQAEPFEAQWLEEPEAVSEEAVESHGWEEIYPEAAAGDGAEMDLMELESHYDLGIGYKEMGMYAGAIKELEIAAANPQRRFACLTLQAICYREKGEPERAEDLLRRGLALSVISKDERIALSYELAVLFEGTGRTEEAIEFYREVVRGNPAYQNASDRLFALSGEEPLDIIDLELEE
ncbi:tetratricopeptide repeat protein [Geomonas ferrireducens]|uniref:tetratricopeptide repeat protein n=1 Tax=Geomonas ferrireducens TaxID=2570227 RepID=UPI0010A93C4B|nr:tetratricopeptide repeat protein [Geomonas ferrireducens]